jgi:hypothetical protein
VFERPAEFLHREIEVASVNLTMPEIAAAFSRVLGKTYRNFNLVLNQEISEAHNEGINGGRNG